MNKTIAEKLKTFSNSILKTIANIADEKLPWDQYHQGYIDALSDVRLSMTSFFSEEFNSDD